MKGKTKIYGYTGKILRIDLTTGTISNESTIDYANQWLGGNGINQRIIYRELRHGVSPYEPANKIVIGSGPLVGTLAPGACRTSIASKNTFSCGVGSANMGGHFGPELKFAGYDHIILEGKARTPVYLWIHDEHIELKDCREMWGRTTRTTEKLIKQELGDDDIQIMSIGPAGENLVRGACIISNRNRAAGRCGIGAVMGSKNLKAIAVRGTGSLEVAYPERFMQAVDASRERLKKANVLERLRKYGTVAVIPGENAACSIGYRNFQGSCLPPEHLEKIAPDVFYENYMKRDMGCFGCPLYCDKYYEVDHGPYAGLKTEGFNYDAVSNFGGKLGIDYAPAIIMGCVLCDELGIDTVAGTIAIAWAFECYQRGILTQKDTDGLKLEWGDYGVVFELLKKIAYRDGFGNILAEGSKRASEKIGGNSGYYSMHMKSQELYEEIRMPIGWGFGTSVATRGGGHTTGTPLWEKTNMGDPQIGEFALGLGFKTLAPETCEDKPELTIYTERMQGIINSLGLCMFTAGWHDPRIMTLKDLAELYSAAVGWEKTELEFKQISDRILNLERAFNAIHANLSRKDDYPPQRMLREPVNAGRFKGFALSKEKYDQMLDKYYDLRGWDRVTGLPNKKCLKELQLEEVADDLDRLSKSD